MLGSQYKKSFVTGTCNFEEHACGWINSSKDEFKWRREMANISAVPGVDHTTGSPWGKPLDLDNQFEFDLDHVNF